MQYGLDPKSIESTFDDRS